MEEMIIKSFSKPHKITNEVYRIKRSLDIWDAVGGTNIKLLLSKDLLKLGTAENGEIYQFTQSPFET